MPPLPFSYMLAILAFVLVAAVGIGNLRRRPWAVAYLTVLATVGAWYLGEPLYYGTEFERLEPTYVASAFTSVTLFIISFGAIAPVLARAFAPSARDSSGTISSRAAEQLLFWAGSVWLVLFIIGVSRINWDVLAGLFPIRSRAGANMWARAAGAEAGSAGFLISSASYVYVLTLSSFGMLLPILRQRRAVVLACCLIALTWPYAFLQGSRNITLAVFAPSVASYLLFSRHYIFIKVLAGVLSFVFINLAMKAIGAFRNAGFSGASFDSVARARHLGLNMASELVHVHQFLDTGVIQISYGGRYLAELANIVPRSLWPSKPLVGIDYAIARGFGSSHVDIGVFATISTGMIGQGVLNFGSILGPVVVAILMSLWVALLTRFRLQATPGRSALFVFGLGLTFNLGRDITLLVLWPFIFAVVGVLFFERWLVAPAQKSFVMEDRQYGPTYGLAAHRMPRSRSGPRLSS